MSPETIIAQLEQINAWRRGEESEPQPDPKHVGEVIDAAVASLHSLIASNATLRRERSEARAEVAENVTLRAELTSEKARADSLREYGQNECREAATIRARVAELEQNREINAKEWESLHADYDALQQRNAELVEQLKAYGKYAGDTTQEARVDELEQSKRTVDFLCELHGCCPEMVLHWCEFEHRQLARAESATAAVVKDSLTTEPGAPAQHPDTVRMDTLEKLADRFYFGRTKSTGRPLLRIYAGSATRDFTADTFRAAIDAARKQGGEK